MMTRSLRRWHACFWMTLGPLIAGGLLVALIKRPATPIQSETRAVHMHPDGSAAGINATNRERLP